MDQAISAADIASNTAASRTARNLLPCGLGFDGSAHGLSFGRRDEHTSVMSEIAKFFSLGLLGVFVARGSKIGVMQLG
jgi:hypothetical protein